MSFFSCGLQIRVVSGPDKGRTFPLDQREITIGRARSAGDRAPGWILLNDSTISRIHTDLVWSDDEKGYKLLHRSDTNPTKVNEQPVGEHLVKAGDQIQVGNSFLDVQTADFRFGGVEPERIGQIHAQRQASALPIRNDLQFRDPKRENEEEVDTRKLNKRRIALSKRAQLALTVLRGPQQGKRIELTGFHIQMGDQTPIELPEGAHWWDQDVVLDEAALGYRSLAWHWKELENAFEVCPLRTLESPITLERRVDGTDWIAELPGVVGASVLLRTGDVVYFGNSAVQLVTVEEEF